jgi:hypothetical protein
MKIAGRDYIFKLMSPEFLDSLFNIRKRYFLGGEPSWIAKGKTTFFVAKFKKSEVYKQYTLVGEGQIEDGHEVSAGDKDYSFAIQNDWPYVIELENLKQYSKGMPASEVFPEQVLKKSNSQRPFGVELSCEESKLAKGRIDDLLN